MSQVQGQGQGLDSRDSLTTPAIRSGKAWLAYQRLVGAYGPCSLRPRNSPLDELIATMLSQHTSDVNSARAYANLRQAFPTWEHVVAASEDAVAEAIRVGGLARTKARRIKALLAGLAERRGAVSLDFLADLSTEEARAVLEGIPGVGAKTAACVLLFALGRPVLPVDTHVHRASRRLGLAPDGASPEQVERVLAAALPPEAYHAFHLNLIRHGRQVCRARRPVCESCCLADLCDYCATVRR